MLHTSSTHFNSIKESNFKWDVILAAGNMYVRTSAWKSFAVTEMSTPHHDATELIASLSPAQKPKVSKIPQSCFQGAKFNDNPYPVTRTLTRTTSYTRTIIC